MIVASLETRRCDETRAEGRGICMSPSGLLVYWM